MMKLSILDILHGGMESKKIEIDLIWAKVSNENEKQLIVTSMTCDLNNMNSLAASCGCINDR